MADSVDTLTVFSGRRRKVYRFTNVCDGTGESSVIKIDRSTLTGLNGSIPTYVIIEEMSWNIQGFTSVQLFWDDFTDDEIAMLSGMGYRSYKDVGGLKHPQVPGNYNEGDIRLTTAGNTAGSIYDITLVVRLKD